MEELLSTFVRSIFVDNMIFAYYLGMCSFLAVSKNVKTAMGLGIAVTFVLVCTLPINYMLENYVLKEGALSWLGPQFADVNLSFLAFILFIAIIASFTQLVEMVVEKFAPGYLLAVDRCKLCYFRRLFVYAAKGIPECGCCNNLWFRFRYWMDACYCGYGCHS